MTAPPLDLVRARRDTRGCADLVHFNNAGAALPPAPVSDALHAYLRQEELDGGYETMERQAADLHHFYQAAASLLHCSTGEIAFADSASRAWATALYAFAFRPGDRILIGRAEYGSNLVALLHHARRSGAEIVPVPDDPNGHIDLAALAGLMDPRVRLICLTHIPSGNGLIQPAAAVGRLARAANVPFLLDACQSLGQLPVDVDAVGCDLLCGTGRKFLRGPRGTGLLYVRQEWIEKLEPPLLNHHAALLTSAASYELQTDARRFEFWERSCAGQLALGVAMDYARGWGLEAIRERIDTLAEGLRTGLAQIPGVCVAEQGTPLSGIVTFFCAQIAAPQLQQQLARKRINLSIVPFSANPLLSELRGLPELLRASLHYYNSEEEVGYVLDELRKLLRAG